MSKLNEFISNSKSFNGFEFRGNFTLLNEFTDMYDIYLRDGVNLLDAYSDYVYLSWGKMEVNECKTFEECDKLHESLSLLRKYKLVDPDDLCDARHKVAFYRSNYKRRIESQINAPRKNACSFTKKLAVKNEVIRLHGDKCLCCGSTKITLDHVIPVHLGGKNEIANLQPLCKSCNSKKSTKIIDYR